MYAVRERKTKNRWLSGTFFHPKLLFIYLFTLDAATVPRLINDPKFSTFRNDVNDDDDILFWIFGEPEDECRLCSSVNCSLVKTQNPLTGSHRCTNSMTYLHVADIFLLITIFCIEIEKQQIHFLSSSSFPFSSCCRSQAMVCGWWHMETQKKPERKWLKRLITIYNQSSSDEDVCVYAVRVCIWPICHWMKTRNERLHLQYWNGIITTSVCVCVYVVGPFTCVSMCGGFILKPERPNAMNSLQKVRNETVNLSSLRNEINFHRSQKMEGPKWIACDGRERVRMNGMFFCATAKTWLTAKVLVSFV